METTELLTKTIALIHNSNLPRPFNVLSTAIADDSKRSYLDPRIPSNYEIQIVDLAAYDIDSAEFSLFSSTETESRKPEKISKLKSLAEWQTEISKHSGFILLFPYHTWSYCTPLKNALNAVPPHVIHKPALMLGFGKEELYHPNDSDRTWQKKSFSMMRDFLLEKGVKLVDMEKAGPGGWPMAGWPEFTIYADYWELWVKGEYHGGEYFIGGQQSELWETKGHNRCQRGIEMLIAGMEKNGK